MTPLDVIGLDKNLTVNDSENVTRQIFWAVGENRRGFGLKVMRKSKIKKKIVNK